MGVIKVPKDTLLGRDLPFEAIEDTIIDHSRWSVHHEIIFEMNGKFWRTNYSVGATEQQDEGPWDYEDSVEITEVQKVEKTITTTVWENV